MVKTSLLYSICLTICIGCFALIKIGTGAPLNSDLGYVGLEISRESLAKNPLLANCRIIIAPRCTSCSAGWFPKPRKLDSDTVVISLDKGTTQKWELLANVIESQEFQLHPNLPLPSPVVFYTKQGKIVQVIETPSQLKREFQ